METGRTGLETIYTDRYEACFGLYLRCGGVNLSWVEREMRALGYADFNRRILYSRKERGVVKPGWIEKFGWREHLGSITRAASSSSSLTTPSTAQKTSGGHPSANKEGSATIFSPPVLGGAAPASGDGVVTPADPSGPLGPKASFEEWLKQVSPELTWDWAYQKHIYKYLQRVTDGTCKRLMIFMPPRHGKSELVTVRYAGWRLWNDPKMKIIVSSYNQKLADRFSRGIRRLLSEEEDIRASSLNSPPYEGGVAPASRDGVVLPDSAQAQAESKSSGGDVQRTTPPATEKRPHPPLLRKEGCQSASSADPAETASHPDHSQIANRNSQITRMFPKTRAINTASQWETSLGGGVKAVGVGAGVTGFGGQLIVIDDPVKSRAEAESSAYRERLWDWYRNDLYTRLEPDAAVILIQTRWHQDDLAGRLLQEMQTGGDRWEVIDLPALAEHREARSSSLKGTNIIAQGKAESRNPGIEPDVDNDPEGVELGGGDVAPLQGAEASPDVPGVTLGSLAHPRLLSSSLSATRTARQPAFTNPHSAFGVPHSSDPLGRPVGAALCPDRFDEAILADIQRQLGGYAFSALYQQHPTPAEGGIFKRAWFTRFVDAPPPGLKWKRGYDLAVSTKTTACYTASFRIAVDERTGDLYIADGFRERIEYPDQKRYIIDRVTTERDTEHGVEKALHGQAMIQELRRETSIFGQQLRGIDVTADKVTRALTWAPLAEEGKIVLVRGDWNRAFLDELANFPAAEHDDQIDAVSLAVSMLKMKRRQGWSFN